MKKKAPTRSIQTQFGCHAASSNRVVRSYKKNTPPGVFHLSPWANPGPHPEHALNPFPLMFLWFLTAKHGYLCPINPPSLASHPSLITVNRGTARNSIGEYYQPEGFNGTYRVNAYISYHYFILFA